MRRSAIATVCLVMLIAVLEARQGRRGTPSPPDLTGQWTGTWSAYNPARATTPPKELCAKLIATIAKKDDGWQASFEGDCGRPYKYQIVMEGRPVGGTVMFKGTTDLGPNDGGVYDWIGRADNNEFVGFFTSAPYTGVFSLTRVK